MKKASTFFIRNLAIAFFCIGSMLSKAQISFTTNVSSVCVATPTNYVVAQLTATPSGAASYSWSILPGNCGTFLNASALTATFNISCAANYTITCDALNSSSQVIATATSAVVGHVSTTVSALASPSVICKWESSTLVANGATSYTWNPGNIVASSIVVSPTMTSLYTVIGEISSTGCTGTANAVVIVNPSPTVNITVSPSWVCLGQTATLSVQGPGTFTWNTGSTGNQVVVPAITNTCFMVMGSNNCFFATSCLSLGVAPPLTLQGSSTVCLGTSVTFTAAGGIAYQWHNMATTNTLNILSATNTSVSVTAPGTMGCKLTLTAGVTVDPNCSDVWPGDANSDGNVTSADVFEIGLAFNATGVARSPGGNTYVAQQAANWSGTVSTGKNLCHADCNGDGTIDNADTLAIFANFGLLHAFKPAASSSNPDVSLVAPTLAYGDSWNVADVMVGSSATSISQLYGLAFDVDFDAALIDAAYLVFTPSFLNTSNQTIKFRKSFNSDGKVVGVIVRTDKNNVGGNGKIAELHFKVKAGVSENTTLNFSIANVQKLDRDGLTTTLVPGNLTQAVTNNLVGLKKQADAAIVEVFPNPVSKQLTVRTSSGDMVTYVIEDLSGRVAATASFVGNTKVDVSTLASGVYFVKLKSSGGVNIQKVIVAHQ